MRVLGDVRVHHRVLLIFDEIMKRDRTQPCRRGMRKQKEQRPPLDLENSRSFLEGNRLPRGW